MNPTIATMPEVAPASWAGEEPLYEVVNGQRKELPPMGAYEGRVATLLVVALGHFVESQDLGRMTSEVLFNLAPIKKQRRPDAAFVSYARWAKTRPMVLANAWDVVPDLAVEVVSPTDAMVEVLEKVREYFQSGVQLVWLVLPSERMIYVYQTLTQIRVLTHADVLEGGAIIPGFQFPVAALFTDAPQPS
jgi:Uma2 family endonuclease